MSWFRHKPAKNPPPARAHTAPHRSSPASERAMEEAKAIGPKKSKQKSNTS